MTTKAEILALADRVGKHTGGDSFEIRREIAEALGWTRNQVGGVIAWYSPDEPDRMRAGPPKWLTSIDAAIGLLPDFLSLTMGLTRYPWCNIWTTENERTQQRVSGAESINLPCAITAACLRAIAEGME